MTPNEERRPDGGGAHVSFGSGTRTIYPNDPTAAIDAFLAAMRAAGVGVPEGGVVADGRLHRFRGEGDKPGKENGWYVLHVDSRRPAGAFGSWRTGTSETWAAGTGERLTAAERAELRRKADEAKRQRDAERRATQRSTATTVWDEWARAKPADPRHPYLVAKGVQPHGLRQRGRLLLVPFSDAGERLWNLQRIDPDGTKRFATGGRITGLFSRVGGDPDAAAALLLVCEGWATAATLTEATGLPALAAMNCGNLEPVAKVARRWWPYQPLVIAADNDHGTAGNPGLTKAHDAALATGAAVVAPPTMRAVTDFNDLGHAETRRALLKIMVPMVPVVPGDENVKQNNDLRGVNAGTKLEPNAVPWFHDGDGRRADV